MHYVITHEIAPMNMIGRIVLVCSIQRSIWYARCGLREAVLPIYGNGAIP